MMFFQYLKASLIATTMISTTQCYGFDNSQVEEVAEGLKGLLIEHETIQDPGLSEQGKLEALLALNDREELIHKICNSLISNDGLKQLKLHEVIPHDHYENLNSNELLVISIIFPETESFPASYLREIRKRADANDPIAQTILGFMYHSDRGVAQDKAQAVHWYEKAALQGFAMAQFNLGFIHQRGLVVAQDEAQAVDWYEKAALQGFAPAQRNLGFMHYQGQGVAQDYARAFHWFEKAALQSDAIAQNALGFMYQKGQGVDQCYAQAFQWYEKAALQGHAPAQSNLGIMYEEGIGVVQDNAQAFHWHEKAALQGDADAQEIFCSNLKPKEDIAFSETLTPDDAEEVKALKENFQNLTDYYVHKQAFAGLSGLSDTLAANPYLAQSCNDIVQHLKAYQDILDHQVLAPGYLMSGLKLAEDANGNAIFKELISPIPGANDDYVSFLSLDYFKETTEEKLKVAMVDLWRKTWSALTLMQDAGANSEKLGKMLKALEVNEHPSFGFINAVAEQYLKTNKDEDYKKAIDFLKTFMSDLEEHKEFAIHLNERFYDLLRNTAPYRNHLSKQKYAFLYR